MTHGPMPAGPPDGSAPHVVVDDVDHPVVDDDSLHHLARVRRVATGDAVTVTDGAGRWRWCRYRGSAELENDGDVVSLAAPLPAVTVAFALTKGDRPDQTVQKLTELGVDRIVPFRAARSVVRWDEAKAARNLERWRAIARGAVEQSHRCWLPSVDAVTDVAALVAMGAVRVDRGGEPPRLAHTVVAVGPEGGWTDEERTALPEAVALGEHVLRADTAASTAGALICSLRSGMVSEAVTGSPRGEKAG